MPNVVSIVTGPIVGLRSTWFLEDTVEFAARTGRKIVVFNLFDEILKQAGMYPRNAYEQASYIGELLDGYQYQLRLMREKAYLSIAREIDKLPGTTNVIVRTPASVEWRGVNLEFKDHRIIGTELKPQRIVTLIDAEWKIMKRLKTEYGKHALKTLAHQKGMTLERILRWLGSEVSRSEDWAEWATHLTGRKVRHFVLGIETPSRKDRDIYVRDVDNMTKLAAEKRLPSFYASYSMTVATEEIRKEINDTIWRLRGYGAVIDPASIEIGQNINPEDESVVFAYTVCRDLRWDVKKVDIVSAFHPYTEMPPLSTGMLDELGHARAFRKERYMVLPAGGGSPFTGDNLVPAERIFKNRNSFFRYLEQKRKPALKPRFADITKEFGKWQEKVLSKRKRQSAKR
ncbi:hypothetical protein KAW55_03605 [bacterium]|nr:hypothetical protein [bacterium]